MSGGNVIGRLAPSSGGNAVLIQAAQTVTIDSKKPVIANETPSATGEVSNGRPRVSATLDDGNGSGVDTEATKIIVDGRDVTGDENTVVTANFVTYQPSVPLSDGEHRVRIVTADMVGNEAEREWRSL